MTRVIPTKGVVAQRLGGSGMSYGICRSEVESLFHLFKDCHSARLLAFESKWEFVLDN